MKRPADFSRWNGLTWIRERITATVDHLWRPWRSKLYVMEDDTTPVVTVKCGATDTLWSLCAQYYRSVDRPEQLWWLIAEVNDLVDPTVSLTGKTIVVPPLSVLEDQST